MPQASARVSTIILRLKQIMAGSSLMRISAAETWSPVAAFPDAGAEVLTDCDRVETLEFLAQRGINAAFFAGIVYDNGLESPLNRGTFFGYRNSFGQLEGVGLIGHATLLEAETEQALQALAIAAQGCKSAHMIMCEESRLEKFWRHYAEAGQEMRRASRQLLLELRWPVETSKNVSKLRLATTADLDLVSSRPRGTGASPRAASIQGTKTLRDSPSGVHAEFNRAEPGF